jgi:hypothetical protein
MHSVNRLVVALRRIGWLLPLFALALYALPTEAGPAGRGGGRQRGGPARPTNPGAGQDQPRDVPAGNSHFGKVIKYRLAADDKDENLLGVLSFDPLGKSTKKVDLRVIKEPEPVIDIPDAANFRIELDQIAELITKGLYCDASWDIADPLEAEKKNPKKNLAHLSLTTIEVVGKIEEIGADQFVLRAKPKVGRNWPDLESKAMDELGRAHGATPAKAKPVPIRNLTLKVIDGATRFVDSGNKSLDPGDFQVQQSVEAKIVYGKPGFLVVLIDPNSKSGTEDKSDDGRQAGGGGGRGRPRPPPIGG